MKKIFILFVLFIISNSYSQNLGIKTGLNYTSYAPNSNMGYNKRILFTFSVSYSFYFYEDTDKLKFQLELVFNQKGAVAKGTRYYSSGLVEDFNTKFIHHSLDLPFLAKYEFYKDSKFKSNINLGPYLSYLLSSKYDDDFSKGVDVTSDMTRLEYGILLGIDFIVINNLMIDLRYVLSLVPVYKNDNWNNQHHSMFSFNVGYLFNF